jgi:transposase
MGVVARGIGQCVSDGGCGTVHQRDDNAAINLARYEIPTTVIAPSAQ